MGHTRFVVQSLPRSGAGLVMSALEQHSGCRVAGNVFGGDTQDCVDMMKEAGSWKTLFDTYTLADREGDTAAGFITYRTSPAMQSGRGYKWEWSQTLWQYLNDKGADSTEVITIFREDAVARAISAAMALHTGVTAESKHTMALRIYKAGLRHIVIPPWLFRYYLEEWDILMSLPIERRSYLMLSYEALITDWKDAMSRIQRYLKLSYEEVTSPLAKLGATPPHKTVQNWDLLVAAFRSTKWEPHFERYFNKFLPMYEKQAASAEE